MSPAHLALETSGGRWRLAKHLDFLNRKLVALATKRIRRLIISMPPRHGKSQLCSRYFPAWYLGTFPDNRIIVTGYGTDFATEWGRESRNLLDAYGAELFDVEIRDDSSAAHRWGIAGHDGGLIAAGIGGGITGRGADIFVMDDPIKDYEEAESEVYRQKVWNWWQTTASTRLEPDGCALLIMTRWNEDDLAGRLIKQSEDPETPPEERWEVVNLPAIAEPPVGTKVGPEWRDEIGRAYGEALWPKRYSETHLKNIQHRVGSVTWRALYQGQPSAREGAMFKVHNWNFVRGVPAEIELVRRVDLAATEKTHGTDPDWTAAVLMGRDSMNRFYVIDARRIRASDLEVERFVRDTAAWDRRMTLGRNVPIRLEQEPGSSGKALVRHYARNVLAGFDVSFAPSTGDKVMRARPYAAQQEAGNVFLVEGPWNADFIEEHRVFPNNGSHDDLCDAASHAFLDLTMDQASTHGYARSARPR